MMIKKLIILAGFSGFLLNQDIHLAQQVVLQNGGGAYLVSDEEDASVEAHGITVGQVVVGRSSGSSYDIDFGFWPVYASYGCLNSAAHNYDQEAATDDGSCMYRYAIPLQSGQNLISFLELPDDSSVESTLSSVNTAQSVIAQGAAANNLIGIGWVGSLTSFSLDRGYWLRVNAEEEYSVLSDHPPHCNEITYSLNEGPNLISFPCPDQYSLNEAIPEWVRPHILGIVGEGQAAIGNNGQFIGSLQHLEGSRGYWFISAIDIEFDFKP